MNKVGEGRALPTTMHSKTSSPQVARTLSSIDLSWRVISVSGWCPRSRAHLLGITLGTVLALDPIIPSTAGKVLSSFDFEEQITGVEVIVRTPERDIGTIITFGQDHELQELVS